MAVRSDGTSLQHMAQLGGGTSPASGVTPPARITSIAQNNYRQHGSSTNCTGWEGNLYMLGATWDTDSGQRIGAATEVEP